MTTEQKETEATVGASELSDLLCTETATVMMPRELTAENGAKAALIGEFSVRLPEFCPECNDEEEPEDCMKCAICGGTGNVYRDVNVPWTVIKAIYRKAVETLGT